MNLEDWRTEDRFLSNNGKGQLVARILYVADGVVGMERWSRKGGRRTRFEIPYKTATSPACGWTLKPKDL